MTANKLGRAASGIVLTAVLLWGAPASAFEVRPLSAVCNDGSTYIAVFGRHAGGSPDYGGDLWERYWTGTTGWQWRLHGTPLSNRGVMSPSVTMTYYGWVGVFVEGNYGLWTRYTNNGINWYWEQHSSLDMGGEHSVATATLDGSDYITAFYPAANGFIRELYWDQAWDWRWLSNNAYQAVTAVARNSPSNYMAAFTTLNTGTGSSSQSKVIENYWTGGSRGSFTYSPHSGWGSGHWLANASAATRPSDGFTVVYMYDAFGSSKLVEEYKWPGQSWGKAYRGGSLSWGPTAVAHLAWDYVAAWVANGASLFEYVRSVGWNEYDVPSGRLFAAAPATVTCANGYLATWALTDDQHLWELSYYNGYGWYWADHGVPPGRGYP